MRQAPASWQAGNAGQQLQQEQIDPVATQDKLWSQYTQQPGSPLLLAAAGLQGLLHQRACLLVKLL